MEREAYRKIIELMLKASDLARSIGIANLLQPGLVKEMIIADILGHELIHSKRDADAHAPGNPNEKYEYLSCKEGGSGQLDRMFKEPPAKRQESLTRITRNAKIYYAVFYAANQTRCKIIYELEPDVVLAEAERQLNRSRNAISHIGFGVKWARRNGKSCTNMKTKTDRSKRPPTMCYTPHACYFMLASAALLQQLPKALLSRRS